MLGTLIGIILSGGIVYAATLYKASDVSYQPSDASWEVNNVNDALNSLNDVLIDLQESQQNNVKKALVFTSSPVDMTQYTDRWAELTTADFKVGVTNVSANITGSGTVTVCRIGCSATPSYSYNNTTGVLTFANGSCSATECESPADNYVQGSTSGIFAVWLGTIGGK